MSLVQELRVTVRSLRRAPALAGTAVLVLGLGIGSAAAMFTVADAVLLRPLPVRDADRIVLPRTVDARDVDLALTVEDLTSLRGASHTLSEIAGEAHQGAFGVTLRDGDRPLVFRAAWVTGNFFDVLGVRPFLGRLFRPEEESLQEAGVLVLSYDTWQRRFGGDSDVIGRRLTSPYTMHRYTIIGVAPAGLDYPAGVEYWSPIVYGSGLDVIARLAPGVGRDAARTEFLAIMRQRYRQQADRDVHALAGARVRTLPEAVLGDVRAVLGVLAGAVALLLLLACVNVGNLLLLRLTARRHEIAVRRSLGAGAGDIVRGLLIEGVVLGAAGGALGLVLATALTRALLIIAPTALPRTDLLRLAGAPWAAATGLALVTALLVSVLPALVAVRRDPASPLRVDVRAGQAGAHRRLRQWFVASQVALALVVLAGAGLLVRSLERLQRIDLGYEPEHLALLQLATPVTPADADRQFNDLLDRVAPALRLVPGVTAVTPMAVPPFYGPQVFNATWEVEGESVGRTAEHPRIPIEGGGPEYFRALGIRLLQGRGFLEGDRANAPKVAVVSEAALRLLELGTNPIGRRIRIPGDTGVAAWRTIVGIAGDIHYRDLRRATPTIYLPSRQFFFQGLLAVRTQGSLRALLPALTRALHDADPAASVVRSQTMTELVSGQRALPRFTALLLSGFAVVALVLAAIGLYGLTASAVRADTREIGVRMALGATPTRLGREILRRALGVSVAGAAVGLVGALAGARLIRSLLFEVSPTDPITLGAVSALLVAVALAAAYLPARRAMRIDPAQALRAE